MFFDLLMFDIQWENKGYSICQILQNNDPHYNVCMQFNLSKLWRICALIRRNLACPHKILAMFLQQYHLAYIWKEWWVIYCFRLRSFHLIGNYIAFSQNCFQIDAISKLEIKYFSFQ